MKTKLKVEEGNNGSNQSATSSRSSGCCHFSGTCCYRITLETVTTLLKNIQAEERKRFAKLYGDEETWQKLSAIVGKQGMDSPLTFLDQAIQRAVEKTANKIMFYWKQAMVYSEDTKSCLDRKIMLNHFNEIKELFTHPTKEDK